MATSSKAGNDPGIGQRHPLGLLGNGLPVEEPGSEQIGEHACGHKQADDKTDDDGRALSLLHVAGLGGLDVAVIVPGALDERRSGGFRGSGLLASAAARGERPSSGRNRSEKRWCADRVQS